MCDYENMKKARLISSPLSQVFFILLGKSAHDAYDFYGPATDKSIGAILKVGSHQSTPLDPPSPNLGSIHG